MKDNPYRDEYERADLVSHTCPCCNHCRLFVTGRKAGRCFYGGPYLGYMDVGVSDEDRISLKD